MTVSIDQLVTLAPDAALLRWSSTLPTPIYRILRNGIELEGNAKRNTGRFTVSQGDSVVIQVLDDVNEVPIAVFDGDVVLNWPASTGTKEYRIEKLVAAVWTRQAVIAETGRDAYVWRSGTLEDGVLHQFRVIAVGTDKNESTPATFNFTMFRHPDRPGASLAYSDSTKKITVTIAA